MSSSYLLDYKRSVPYWLESEIRWTLDDGYYHPNSIEHESVVAFLEKRGMSIARNNVNRWLGTWYVSRTRHQDPFASGQPTRIGKRRGAKRSI